MKGQLTSIIGAAKPPALPSLAEFQQLLESSPTFKQASENDLARSTQLAADAFKAFVIAPANSRVGFLRGIADALEEHAEYFVACIPFETALPEARVRGELGRTAGQLRMFADLITNEEWRSPTTVEALPDRAPLPRPELRSMRVGIGPVAVFGASNFPLAFSVAGGDTASALAAGCPVIVKAHSAHPVTSFLTGAIIAHVANEQGLPEGIFSMLYDEGYEMGAQLVKNPHVKAVGFTGSLRGGTALMEIARSRPEPIPVFAEMSSSNPIIAFPSKWRDDDAAFAAGLAGSITLGNGQFCTKPALVFLIGATRETADAFYSVFDEALSDAQPGTMLTETIARSYQAQTAERAEIDGVGARFFGEKPSGEREVQPSRYTCSSEVFLNHLSELSEEIFGPTTLFVEVATPSEAATILSNLSGQLTVNFFAEESDLVDEAGSQLRTEALLKAGRIVFNQYPTGVEVCAAIVHGGPFPATSDGVSTSVGTLAIDRFSRPVCWQNAPESCLPEAASGGA